MRKYSKTRGPRRPIFSLGRKIPTKKYYRSTDEVPNVSREQKSSSIKTIISNIINWVIVIVIAGLLLKASTLSTRPIIKMQKNNYSYRNIKEYQLYSEKIMKESIFNRSKLFFKSKKFENNIKQKFPELSSVNAVIPLATRDLTVFIQTSKPTVKLINGGESGLVDGAGVLVDKGDLSTYINNRNLLNVSFTKPQSNFTVGSKLFTKEEMKLLGLLNNEVPKIKLSGIGPMKIGVIKFNITNRQMEIHLTNTQFYVKINTHDNSREQVGALKATLLQLDREGSLPTKYIDVRVPGRVFVL